MSLHIIDEHRLQLLAPLLNCGPSRQEIVESTHTRCLIVERIVFNIETLLMHEFNTLTESYWKKLWFKMPIKLAFK